MLLDALKDFNWYNEPENVRFTEEGMVVETRPNTDFWQSAAHYFHKDNGHFFYKTTEGDFSLTVKVSFPVNLPFAQCGIMVRADNLNWVKASFLSPDINQPQIGSVVTNCGQSDWAVTPLVSGAEKLWFRLNRKDGDFILYYSTDGDHFKSIRLFRLLNHTTRIQAGAYACNPGSGNFTPLLETVELT